MYLRAKYLLRSRVACRLPRYRKAILELVTPFAPYCLSDFHLSSEIFEWGVAGLNPKSRDVRAFAEEVSDGDCVYCQADLLDDFVANCLPRIRSPFVLLTGKWTLPAVEPGPATDVLLSSDLVTTWYSQNLPFEHPRCRPFPYGVMHLSAPLISTFMKADAPPREPGVYVGHVGVHDHLSDEIRRSREALRPRMDRKRPLREYLERVRAHRFLASPQGDRPDTYRHWEAIALGTTPISDLPSGPLRALFRESMVFVDRMDEVISLDPSKLPAIPPDQDLVRLSYWARRLGRPPRAVTEGE